MNGPVKITIQRKTENGDPVISTYRVGGEQLKGIMKIILSQKGMEKSE
jgi:hypothetical protein